MSGFPEPIPLPKGVEEARQLRLKRIIMSAVYAAILRLAIVVAEFIGVGISGSAALLTDAIFSLVDVGFSLLLIACVVLAGRPPDEDHPFGHGRYEPLVGLQSGFFMVLLGAGMFIQQLLNVQHVSHNEKLDQPIWIIPLMAVILLEIAYRMVIRTARKQNSPALVADAAHYRIDSLTSLFAMIALVLADLIPAWSGTIDHLGALMISLLMIVLGIYAARENLNQIVDRTPDRKFFDLVREAVLKVDGVKELEKTRIQLYGPDAHVDVDVEVEPTLSVEAAHVISQKVRVSIQEEWSQVRDVIVHIEPYYPGDHK